MSYNKILIEEINETKKIILNRPEKRNSLDEELITELTDAFKNYSEDSDTKSIILTGAGGNFCSGLFLDYLQKISEYDILQNKQDSQKFRDLLLQIYSCRKPVIVALAVTTPRAYPRPPVEVGRVRKSSVCTDGELRTPAPSLRSPKKTGRSSQVRSSPSRNRPR